MTKKREMPDDTEAATTFFNRGRRFVVEIVRDNEHLRSKIRRLEDALRGTTEAGRRRGPQDGSADDH